MGKTTTLGGLTQSDFRKIVEGKQVELLILSNKNGLEAAVTNYGAKIVSVHVADRSGKPVDIVQGHNTIDGYLSSPEPYFGAICGRVANRIAKGTFTLEGKEYRLAVNNGANHLHGGLKGFNAVVWDVEQITDRSVALTYVSPDGEEGYPGTLVTKVTYTLADDDTMQIDYEAHTDKTTVINLTNHSFFNLSGADEADICDHLLTIHADTYLPTDETSIPYGAPEPVAGTPMDFRTPHPIGERIEADFRQLHFGKGYDHTYILNKQGNELSFCARAVSPKTGIVMEVYTTEPGVQLYTGNWLSDRIVGKYGKRYPERTAFCLETQHYPDSIHQPQYPSVILRAGEVFRSKTIHKFYINK
jgi:aldose 1-epimerase